MKRIFTLSLIAVIALMFWGQQIYEKSKTVTVLEEAQPHFIDLYMKDFELTAMDSDGKPSYTLQARQLEHYRDDSHSTLQEPVIHLLKTGNRWVISAHSGTIDEEQSRIILRDNVVMLQQETATPVRLNTSLLEIDTGRQIAQTDHRVYIDQQEFKLQSDGMILDNAAGKLELLASVKGSYVPAN